MATARTRVQFFSKARSRLMAAAQRIAQTRLGPRDSETDRRMILDDLHSQAREGTAARRSRWRRNNGRRSPADGHDANIIQAGKRGSPYRKGGHGSESTKAKRAKRIGATRAAEAIRKAHRNCMLGPKSKRLGNWKREVARGAFL